MELERSGMSYRAREFVAPATRVLARPQRDWLPDALRAALGDVDRALRVEYPDVFARVDELLATPGRERSGTWVQADTSAWETRECGWCGDGFAVRRTARGRCCSNACAGSFLAWSNRRAAS